MPAIAFLCLLALAPQTKYIMPLAIGISSGTPLVPLFHKDKAYLAYELEIFNYNPVRSDLTMISVTDAKGKVLGSFTGDDLRKCLVPQWVTSLPSTTLEPGRLVVAFMWLAFPRNAIPEKIGHTLTFKRDDPGSTTVSGGRLQLSAKRGVIVEPPLQGSNWIAGDAPSNTSDHRRTRMCLGGRVSIGQRFAIDWLKVDRNGRTLNGPADRNESYFAYNEKVLACANAKVAVVVDDVKENVPHSDTMAVIITPRTVPGNHVILDLGHGLYAAYAHMIPGSIRVKAGQRLRPGQLIGRLGNSGNSREPHLHFQIMNAPDFLMSEGLPFGHPLLTIQSTELTDGSEIMIKLVGPRSQIKNQMPLENEWVAFPR